MPHPTEPLPTLEAFAPGDLEVFIRVALAGSFRAAAERSGLSQPAVTQRIQRLEAQIGLALFHRSTRRVELTDAGRRLKERAERTLSDLRRTLGELHAEAQVRAGRLNIMASQTMMAPYAIPAVMVRFMQAHPEVRLNVVDIPWNAVLSQLAEGQIELAFVAQEGLSPSLHCDTLFTEELVPVASRMLHRNRRRMLSEAEFARLPVVCVAANSAADRMLRALHERVGSRFTPVMQASRLSSVIGMMQAGIGVALLPKDLAGTLKNTVELSVEGQRFERRVAMVRDGRRPLSPQAERFAAMAQAYFKRTQGRQRYSD